VEHNWFCLEHNGVTELDVHGRCERCGSNAVDHAAHHSDTPTPAALEKLLLDSRTHIWSTTTASRRARK
jgi:hypothetical protein